MRDDFSKTFELKFHEYGVPLDEAIETIDSYFEEPIHAFYITNVGTKAEKGLKVDVVVVGETQFLTWSKTGSTAQTFLTPLSEVNCIAEMIEGNIITLQLHSGALGCYSLSDKLSNKAELRKFSKTVLALWKAARR